MNTFQTILVSVFLAFFVFAVLIFSGLIKVGGSGSSGKGIAGKVVIWGTFKNPDIYKVFDDLRTANQDLQISYVIKKDATYQADLIEAFARGAGPDLFFITEDMVQKNLPFIYKLPYASYSEKTFRDTFLDAGSVYLDPEGVVALPIVADPLVLYYNKDIVSNEGLAQIPTYWGDLFSLTPKLTKKKEDGSIGQSTIALGLFSNVRHAKDIVATLLLQSGNPIVGTAFEKYTPHLLDTARNTAKSQAEGVLFIQNLQIQLFPRTHGTDLLLIPLMHLLEERLHFILGAQASFSQSRKQIQT
jgi:maltose-binding protein MalE